MNNLEKGFLGVAAVCAAVVVGWAFWEYVWTPAVDIFYDHGEEGYPGGHIVYYDAELEPWADGRHMTLSVTCSMPSTTKTTMWIDAPGWTDLYGRESPFEFRLVYGTHRYPIQGAEGLFLDGSYDLSKVTITVEDRNLGVLRSSGSLSARRAPGPRTGPASGTGRCPAPSRTPRRP